MSAPSSIFLASSNAGKLREFRALAQGGAVSLDLLPGFQAIPPFDESAPTFAENAAGKALHCSRGRNEFVMADDSGLVVAGLGGAPGVHSARYAGADATSAERIAKLLSAMRHLPGGQRQARFVCVIALARRGRVVMVTSADIEGEITSEPSGTGGFGYDPVFLVPDLGRTFAELAPEKKNWQSHRGRAFRKLLGFLDHAETPLFF
jgi:XTP/dITP diphosphohydrolase